MLDETISADAAVGAWLSALDKAGDREAIADIFLSESYWRDAMGVAWDIRTLAGRDEIAAALADADLTVTLDTTVAPDTVTRVGREVVEAFLKFETPTGRGRGLVRLAPDADGRMRAWTLLTALQELKGHEARIGERRPTGQSHSRDFRGPNWADQRAEAVAYADHDPTVLIVGGGQAGLATAAQLAVLGIDALIVDRNARIGDNWRLRYHALTLHNQVQVNHLPFMPFPPNWPTYIPKDKLANWFEAYVEALELNFWTSTEMLGGTYDAEAGQWEVRLRRDGEERVMHPRHVVMATGVSGIPNVPRIPTLENFKGSLLHSSDYRDGEDWLGKSAIIIGTGNSGHDIAQDLTQSGARVTMVQRSPTLVVNIEPSAQLPYKLYSEGLALEECDLIATSMPVPLMREAHQAYTKQSAEMDSDLLAKLEDRGFKLDFGEDGTGWQFKYLTRGGGYYFNVGASDLIAAGEIDVIQYDEIERFTESGALLRDGREIPADLVVLSTGYQSQEVLVERLFGKETADKVGPIWGFGEGLELRNMYVRTGQPGLFFIAGSLAQCRINSRFLALQIKAVEEGLSEA